MPYGLSSRRGPVRDTFHSSPDYRGATDVEHEWGPPPDDLDPVHTPGLVQRDPSRGIFAFASSWNDEIYDLSAVYSSLLNVGGFTPPTDINFSLWPQGVYAHNSFTSHPNLVSGDRIFPQNSGPLIQSPDSPYRAARLSPTIENTQPNQFQLSGGSQGRPLIADEHYVRSEMLVRWRCLTFDFSQNSLTQHSTLGISQHNSPEFEMTMVPQRPYPRTRDSKRHKPIIFKVDGRLGIPVHDAIAGVYAGLEGRDDRVFVNKPSVLMLRLEVRPIVDREAF